MSSVGWLGQEGRGETDILTSCRNAELSRSRSRVILRRLWWCPAVPVLMPPVAKAPVVGVIQE